MPSYFITLTVTNEIALKYNIDYTKSRSFQNIEEEKQYVETEKKMITDLFRLWRKRLDKKGYKQRHWCITENGQNNNKTQRIHVHGILWTEQPIQDILNEWKAGKTDAGKYVNERTIPYLVKYISKEDELHPNFRGKIFTSPKIGETYLTPRNRQKHKYRGKETNEMYKTPRGIEVPLCEYYRKKLYTPFQIEELRLIKNNYGKLYIKGQEYDIQDHKSMKNYIEKMAYEQKKQPKYLRPTKKNQEKISNTQKTTYICNDNDGESEEFAVETLTKFITKKQHEKQRSV